MCTVTVMCLWIDGSEPREVIQCFGTNDKGVISTTDNGILNSNPLEVRLIANLWLLASNLGVDARACGEGGDGEM